MSSRFWLRGPSWDWPTAVSTSGTCAAPAAVGRRSCRCSSTTPRVTVTPDPLVAAELGGQGASVAPTSSSSAVLCPRRPNTNWLRPCGPTGGSMTPGPGCTCRGDDELRLSQVLPWTSLTTSGSPTSVGSPARCPTPHWRPTSARPMCTSRSRCTRVSASPSWRRWLPAFRSWRTGSARYAETVGGAALLLESARPVYVAAALHRVCTDERARAISSPRAGQAGGPDRAGGRTRRRRRVAGGRTAAMKVAFVTPRYGPQVMGGAESAARAAGRAPAGHDRLGVRGPHHLRARPPHLGGRARAR